MKNYSDELAGFACADCGGLDYNVPTTGFCKVCEYERQEDTECVNCHKPIGVDESMQFDGICLTCAENMLGKLSYRVQEWHERKEAGR